MITEQEQAVLDKWLTKATSDDPKNREYKLEYSVASALGNYLFFGIHPGNFLEAWLSGDLKGTMSQTGKDTSWLRNLFMTCWWRMPSKAWGSERAFNVWRRYAKKVGAQHIARRFETGELWIPGR